ncbi:YARHG domain-containing protein [Devosia rhodophyticola]|uniref:YARHG domain-containing protein n=1 Tax=Devosia rhodophyticola TaxID=3026423 RepID=A0ABY7YZC2_9HYPH|nr:YARHG domain-containing protein [Devosia rhodophyticola]WDR06740.1 YARHG domain-containing protein [Devosia rhodophyticola]
MGIRTIAIVASLLAGTSGAMANCYEDLGCDNGRYFTRSEVRQLSCQVLWELRNSMYHQNGYCFKTQRGINSFGNEGCYISDQAGVSLNAYERANIGLIVATEKAKGCR